MILLKCFLDEIKEEDKTKSVEVGEEEERDELLIVIRKQIDKKDKVWPELLRLIVV